MQRRTRWAPLLLLLAFVGETCAEDASPRRLIGRVSVRGDGFVRVSAEDLRTLGIRSRAEVRVERGGEPVPLCTSVPGEGLVFLALDTAGAHTATAVYELVQQEPPASTVPCLAATAVASSEAPAHVALHAVRVHAEDRVYGSLGGGCRAIYAREAPTWFLHRLEHEGRVQHTLDGRGAHGAQTIRATIHGTYLGPVALSARWGAAELGLAKADDAAGGATLTWTVPAAAVPRAPAALVLTNRSPPLPTAPANDLSIGRGRLWIDTIVLDGPRIAAMDETLCLCALGEERVLWVRGPEDAAAARRDGSLLVVDAEGRTVASVALPADGPAGPWLRIEPPVWPTGGRLVACATARPARVTPAQTVADPLQATRQARHVILAVPALLAGARKLAAHRSQNGLPSVAVDVSDVYATYGHGEQTPQAIHAFVRKLRTRPVPLEYLLLAGDAIHDRTDWSSRAMIPAPMARTLWNGATPSDQRYAEPRAGSEGAPTAVGRLPFRTAESMQRYVARLIEHETNPPADGHRRLLRFLAGGVGMGVGVNQALESGFRMVLGQALDPAFDVEVTYASRTSPYYWPLDAMNTKVVSDLNRGCLIYTYVGHGTSHESDMRAAWDGALGIFTHRDVQAVDIRGPRPTMLVLASSSAAFDLPKREGLGEALLKRPNGPLAYWGATRFCNPVYNVLVAWGLAESAGRAKRVGALLGAARATLDRTGPKYFFRTLVLESARARWPDLPAEDLLREGNATYTLLGDPALLIGLPQRDLAMAATRAEREVDVTVRGALPANTTIHVHLARRRNDVSAEPKPVANPDDPTSFDKIRAVHAAVNDRVLVRTTLRLENGVGRVTLRLPKGRVRKGMIVVAHAVTSTDVHHGALVLK